MVILVRLVVNCSWAGSFLKPKAMKLMIIGMKICIKSTKISRTKIIKNRILDANLLAWFWSLWEVRIGIKAELKAPSAKVRRKKLGILRAVKKASLRLEMPMNLAIKMSRMKPKMRDMKVKEANMMEFFNNINNLLVVFFEIEFVT